MKFAEKYTLVPATKKTTATEVPQPPRETNLKQYGDAALALSTNLRDKTIPPAVALENNSFLHDNYMEALDKVMKDRNQIVDKLDSIARLIALNTPPGGETALGIRGVRPERETVEQQLTLPPFEERSVKKPKTPSGYPRQQRRAVAKATQLDRSPQEKKGYLKQNPTKLSPYLLRKSGVRTWNKKRDGRF